MMVTPISSTSLAKEAFGRVIEAITSGEFEPGQKLSESQLARQLGISRGPLREALGQLEGRLVRRTPRLGVRVVDFGREELEQLFRVREALEGMAARLAAEHIGNGDLDELRSLLDRHAQQPALAAGHVYVQKSEDDDFHFVIARAAQCPQIERLLLNEVYYQLRLHRLKSSTQPGRAQAALREHHEVLAALQSRDPDRSEEAMRKHIRNARYNALAALKA
jgi:DNA-binding GntR family transcriptional regulator